MSSSKKTLFSGIQPSGSLHIGNYIGAISQFIEMQKNYNCIFCVVDYHAITVRQDPEELNKRIVEIAKVYMASGIDPNKSVIFKQSDVAEHTELAWILNCAAARMSDMNKMTQFKDKAGKKEESVSVGLYDYPVLMAADILLYGTDVVPVGKDQSQHLELTRTLARRFNQTYGETFKIPELVLRKEGALIMGLDDPAKKMSKSAASEMNYIALNDAPEIAKKKIMRAVTDSGSEVKHDIEEKPAISNLLVIYSLLAGMDTKDIEKKYAGKGYGDFKKDLAEIVVRFLMDFQTKYSAISDAEVKKVLEAGAKKLAPIAKRNIGKVKKNIGVII
ncbi:MAG: tryptophan--tRNA ligase [Patescibacteria group bacterium]|jgi:tryptophanyl-tRNA synthetase